MVPMTEKPKTDPKELPERTLRHGSLPGLVLMTYADPMPDYLQEAYLHRLGVAKPETPNLAALTELVAAHVDRVSYENIDVKLGRPPFKLDPVASAIRVAIHKRGGYCFILVNAFALLLDSLGFKVSLHTGTCSSEPLEEEKWGDHVVAVVHLENGAYIADVGLGEGPRSPFPLEPRAWEEDGFSFALEQRPAEGGWRFNNPANVTGILPGFSVDTSTSVASVEEFAAYHHYFWLDKSSGFVKGPIFMHRKTSGRGVLSLHCCTLRRSQPGLDGGYEIIAIYADREEWFSAVRDIFGLSLDDLTDSERERLWAQVSDGHAKWLAQKEATQVEDQLAGC